MFIRRGRFAWLYLAVAFVCLSSFALAIWLSFAHIETELPASPDIFVQSSLSSEQKKAKFEALELKTYPLIDDAAHLDLSIFASKMLARPDCLTAPKAVRLYTGHGSEERDARLGERLYLKRAKGRFYFADLGEKTSIWVIPENTKNAAVLFAEMDVAGKVQKLGQFEVPLLEGGAWPKEGLTIEGICIDDQMLERLGAKCSGLDLLESKGSFRLFFKTYSIKFCPGDWMVIRDGRWQVVSVKDDTEAKPLMRLYEVKKDQLVFEVIDSDGQLHLMLPLSKTPDSIDPHILEDFGPIAFRTLDKVSVKIQGIWKFLPLGQALIYNEGNWEKADLKNPPLGPLLVLNHIEQAPKYSYLIATLYSPMHSKSSVIKLPIERVRRKVL